MDKYTHFSNLQNAKKGLAGGMGGGGLSHLSRRETLHSSVTTVDLLSCPFNTDLFVFVLPFFDHVSPYFIKFI